MAITKFLTDRGLKVFLANLGCAGFAALFMDPFLAILSLMIAGFILYDYKKTKNVAEKINTFIKLNSNSITEVLVAGKKKTIELSCQVNTDLPVNLSSPLKEVQLEPEWIKKGKHTLKILLFSDVSGNYITDKIKARVLGPYRLTKKEGNISFNLELKIFPRVMVALVQAALFLLRGGTAATGDIPTPFKGPGTEYADTREYVPGDSLHRIDWKATARYGKLMVKEFFQEAGQGAHIVYDTRATGAISQDKLAANFLNTSLGAAQQGYPVGVTVHDGKKVLLHSTKDSPQQLLKIAIRYVLQSMRIELEDIDALIDPVSFSQIRSFLIKVKEEQVREFLEFEVEVLRDRLGEPYRFLVEISRKMSEKRHFLLISQLSDEIADILQFADEIRKHHQLTVIQPTKPWKEAENLEQAYRWYERQRKIEKILKRHRIRVLSQL